MRLGGEERYRLLRWPKPSSIYVLGCRYYTMSVNLPTCDFDRTLDRNRFLKFTTVAFAICIVLYIISGHPGASSQLSASTYRYACVVVYFWRRISTVNWWSSGGVARRAVPDILFSPGERKGKKKKKQKGEEQRGKSDKERYICEEEEDPWHERAAIVTAVTARRARKCTVRRSGDGKRNHKSLSRNLTIFFFYLIFAIT